jgi:6-phosphogluconolactonase (cycloisomerase 2 family)
MNRSRRKAGLVLAAALLVFPAVLAGPAGAQQAAGAVYTMTNSPVDNEILVFDRAPDGTLSPAGSYSTGGTGTGTGLGNQSGVVLTEGSRFLLAVNAGSDEVSSFRVTSGGLELADVEPSNGDHPISVTARSGLVYVLHDGSGGNVTGFRLGPDGALEPVPDSTQPLLGAGPAQIQFAPREQFLVVTEKASNTLSVFPVVRGRAQPATSHVSAGETPFGFAFDRHGRLIVSEAFGGAAGASAATSYDFDDGIPDAISPSVPTNQTAACWIVVTKNGRYAYTTNTGSASITGYEIAPNGELTRLDDDGVTATTGAGPIDMALTASNRFLYSLDSGVQQISGWAVNADGSLASLGAIALPGGANGLAAR